VDQPTWKSVPLLLALSNYLKKEVSLDVDWDKITKKSCVEKVGVQELMLNSRDK
jgi:hypothetical protein